jgi:hypothetical protein
MLPCRAALILAMLACAPASWLVSWPAAGQQPVEEVPPQHLAACGATRHPQLPQRWGATFLMAPFGEDQLVLAGIVHDGAIPAMRARLHGLARGSADILVAGSRTFLLSTDNGRIAECRDIGDTGWRSPPADWLGRKAQCVGSGPVAETAVDWWKAPSSPPLANWLWFDGPDRAPFRLMFGKPDDSLSPLSLFAFSYRVRFEALQETDLAAALAFCRARPRREHGGGREALRRTISAMAQSATREDAEIRRLMPELEADCAGRPLPRWPDEFGLATLMTPIDVHHDPLPAEVLYRWGSRSQRTRMSLPPSGADRAEDALLIGPMGYGVTHGRNGRTSCTWPQPGAVRPDWTTAGSCSCEAVINGTTPITPYGPTQIVRCPMTAPRVVWTWYTLEGRPIVFMETASGSERGALLTLADYYAWMPGHRAADEAFARPAQCAPAPAAFRPPGHAPRSGRQPCVPCHLGAASPR